MSLPRNLTLATALLVACSYAASAQTQSMQQAQSSNAERGAQMRATAQACKPDIEKFCAGMQPGGGRIAACLREHASDLSESCKKAALASRQSAPGK